MFKKITNWTIATLIKTCYQSQKAADFYKLECSRAAICGGWLSDGQIITIDKIRDAYYLTYYIFLPICKNRQVAAQFPIISENGRLFVETDTKEFLILHEAENDTLQIGDTHYHRECTANDLPSIVNAFFK